MVKLNLKLSGINILFRMDKHKITHEIAFILAEGTFSKNSLQYTHNCNTFI